MSDDSLTRLGQFDLTDRLGTGGMASVYEARHRRSGTPVAVKVVSGERASDARYREAFSRETQAVAALSHPHVIEVFDYGAVPGAVAELTSGELAEGAPYLVMELAQASLRDEQPQRWGELVDVLSATLDALAAAHAQGVIHRDLKPENILFTDGRLVVADFGLAHLTRKGAMETGDVTLGASSGTPRYMAPEQFLGRWRDFGPWTDLYAVGCIAYEMASGRTPFEADNLVQLARLHIDSPRPRLNARMPVAAGFEQWVHTMLGRTPETRPRFAADALRALRTLEPPEEARKHATAPDTDVALVSTVVPVPEITSSQIQSPSTDTTAPWRAEPRAIPDSWSARDPAATRRALTDVGLSLFGLRRVPIVGRETELETLWSKLVDVSRTRRPSAVVIEGDVGTGRRRLVETFAERAHELGVARRLTIPLDEGVSLARAFGHGIEAYVQTRGLDADPAEDRLREWLALRADLPDVLAAAWTELARPSDRDLRRRRRFVFRSREAYFNTFAHFVSTASADGPALIVSLDGTHESEPLQWAEWFLAQEVEVPVLLLITTRSPMDTNLDRVSVERLSTREQEIYIRRLLPLTEEGTLRLAAHTDGNPEFARQLLNEWIDLAALEPTERGFETPDSSEDWPPDLTTLWTRRLLRFAGSDVEALEIASLMGARVDLNEWKAVVERVGLEVGDLAQRLIERGLARERDQTWWFVDPSLRRHMQEQARQAKNLERWHLAIVETLELRNPGRATASRRATHLEAAGRLEMAADELMHAADYALDYGLRHQVRDYLARRDALLDRLDVPADARERERGVQMEMRILEDEQPVGELERRAERARTRGWLPEAAEWTRLCAVAQRDRGNFEEAADLFERACDLAQEEAGRTTAYARGDLGWVQMLRGEFDSAVDNYRRAIAYFESNDMIPPAASLLSQLGWVALTRGDEANARRHVDRATRLARQSNAPVVEASALNILGEIARFGGDFDFAARCYRESAEIYELFDRRHSFSSQLNLAFTEIARQRWAEAHERLISLEERAESVGLHNRLGVVELALAACAAGMGDQGQLDRYFESAVERVDAIGMVSTDIAWLAEELGRYARQNGFEARAAFELAAAQYEGLEKPDDVERIRAMLEG